MNPDRQTLAALGLTGPIVGLRWALACASLAGVAAVLLLAISGWFLTGAALAGVAGGGAVLAFNFLLPSAAIRGLAIVRTATRYGERLLTHSAALRQMADIRARLFGALAAQDGRNAPDLSGGDATTRLIGDIAALENAVVRRPARPASIVAAGCAVLLVLLAGWQAAVALATMLALLPPIVLRVSHHLTHTPAAALAEAAGDVRDRFVESTAARTEIIAYGIVDRVVADLGEIATRVDRARAALFRAEAAVAGLLVGYGALAATVVLTLSRGSAPLRALALFAAIGAVEAMAAFARDALSRRSVAASLARLSELAALGTAPLSLPILEAPAMSLTVETATFPPGCRVAITGPSGSGKTWLIEALAGLRPAPCAILLDDRAIEQYPAAILQTQYALSPQDATLLAGTVADNLRLARPRITESEMWSALATACIADRIRAMPLGLDTALDEAGGTLSGGERKRLSLARALLAGRPWLLLDEPTEGLDAMTEETVVANLGAWLDRTGTGLILVSHRAAPLALANRHVPIATLRRRPPEHP